MKVKKAVIPAAGFGTRFLPATKAQPKEMLPIIDKPTIQYIIEEAVQAGIEEFLIINGKNKNVIVDHFDQSPELEIVLERQGKKGLLQQVRQIAELADIHFIRQKEAKGLGHAIYCARSFVGDEPFAVLLGDDLMVSRQPVIGQLIQAFSLKGDPIIGVQPVAVEDVSKYGVIDYSSSTAGLYQVKDLVEKPEKEEAPSELAIMGRYVITPDIFPILAATKPGKGNEIQLTDALRQLLTRRNIYACHFAGKRYDVGNKMGFLQATVEIALKREDLAADFRSYLKTLI